METNDGDQHKPTVYYFTKRKGENKGKKEKKDDVYLFIKLVELRKVGTIRGGSVGSWRGTIYSCAHDFSVWSGRSE